MHADRQLERGLHLGRVHDGHLVGAFGHNLQQHQGQERSTGCTREQAHTQQYV